MNLNITFQRVYLTSKSADTTAFWNQIRLCEKEDWQTNVAKDVSGLFCDPLPMRNPGDAFYTLVSVDGRNLYFGESTESEDGTSPAKRPTKIDKKNPWLAAELLGTVRDTF